MLVRTMRSEIAFFTCAIGLSACGGSSPTGPGGMDGGGPTGSNGVPVVSNGVEPFDSFEADKIAAQCATNVRCNQLPTVDGCIAATLPIFSPQVAQDVDAGVIAYDPGLGYRCIQLVLAEPCLGSGVGPPGGADLESCHDAFTGTLPAGTACTLNEECQSDGCSMTACADLCCTGTCAAGTEVRDIPVGGPCFESGCGEGEYCLVSGSSGVCEARVAQGGSCEDALCQQGFVCAGAVPTCQRPAAVGESCAGDSCTLGEACTTPAMVCAAPPAVGDPCTGDYCGEAFNCVNDTCVLPGAIGGSCVGDEGSNQCQEGLLFLGTTLAVTCDQGTCTLVGVATQPSGSQLACLSP
jgi:hypothetical protein